ncbi:MAG: helix-turn-helix domain-containing protein, partial [Chloroflexota bacterium]
MADQELSPSEAARRIGTTTRTVQRWIANGSLPARRVGGRWRVAFDALDAFPQVWGARTGDGRPGQEPGAWQTSPVAEVTAINHVFVANRGEIARRITRTCERLAIR